MKENQVHKVLSPAEILEKMGVSATEKHIDQLSKFCHLFCYLSVGDTFKTSLASFKKISEDLIYIESDISSKQMVEDLEAGKIIQFPG